MALNPSLIFQGLLSMTQNYPSTPAEACRIAADAYEAYAKLGTAQGFPPIITGGEKGKLLAALLQVWNGVESATAAATAAAWYSGITQFWMSPPVLFPGLGPAPGVPIVPPSASAVSCIIGATRNSSSAPPPLNQLAACLDSSTKGVIVLMPQAVPIPGGSLPFPLV